MGKISRSQHEELIKILVDLVDIIIEMLKEKKIIC